jgi:hypothetical protein
MIPLVSQGGTSSVQSTCKSSGQVISGGSVSSMTIRCMQALVFMQRSVAIQVRLITRGQPLLVSSTGRTIGSGSQLSVTVGNPGLPASHSKVISGGHSIIGGVSSTMVMRCPQVVTLPQSSVARYLRRMVPGQWAPSGKSPRQSTSTNPQLSTALTPLVSHGGRGWSQGTVMSAGQVKTGGLVSSMVMVCLQVLKLPHASVAFHVRMIVAGQALVLMSWKLIIGSGSQSSIAVAMPLLPASHSNATSSGQVITGPLVSITRMICTQVASASQSASARQVR